MNRYKIEHLIISIFQVSAMAAIVAAVLYALIYHTRIIGIATGVVFFLLVVTIFYENRIDNDFRIRKDDESDGSR